MKNRYKSGQVMLLVAILTLLITLLTFSVIVVGQIVINKIEMQNIADSAAISINGGMSRNLNAISAYNNTMFTLFASIPLAYVANALVAVFTGGASMKFADIWRREATDIAMKIPEYQSKVKTDMEKLPYLTVAWLMKKHPSTVIIPIPVDAGEEKNLCEPMGDNLLKNFNKFLSKSIGEKNGKIEIVKENGEYYFRYHYPKNEKIILFTENDKTENLAKDYTYAFTMYCHYETYTETRIIRGSIPNPGFYDAQIISIDLPNDNFELQLPDYKNYPTTPDGRSIIHKELEKIKSDLISKYNKEHPNVVDIDIKTEIRQIDAKYKDAIKKGHITEYVDREFASNLNFGGNLDENSMSLPSLPLIVNSKKKQRWVVMVYQKNLPTVLSPLFDSPEKGDIPSMFTLSASDVSIEKSKLEQLFSLAMKSLQFDVGDKTMFFKATPKFIKVGEIEDLEAKLTEENISEAIDKLSKFFPIVDKEKMEALLLGENISEAIDELNKFYPIRKEMEFAWEMLPPSYIIFSQKDKDSIEQNVKILEKCRRVFLLH